MTYVAVVLAAGSARRFGSDKLSALFKGEPLVSHAIRAALAAPASRVIVVAHPALDIEPQARVEVVRIASGALSDSLRTGLAMAGEVDGMFVFLGDMPLVPHDAASRLAERIGEAYAAMPLNAGKPGHPVLLSRRALADAATLAGDAGAGKLLRARDDIVFDECSDPLIHADVDRPEDLSVLTIAAQGQSDSVGTKA